MRKFFLRALSIFCALSMMLTMLPVQAAAVEIASGETTLDDQVVELDEYPNPRIANAVELEHCHPSKATLFSGSDEAQPYLYVGIIVEGTTYAKKNSSGLDGKVISVTDYSTYPLFAMYVDGHKKEHLINPSDCQWIGEGVGINMCTLDAPNAFIDVSAGVFQTKAVQAKPVSFSAIYTTEDGKELRSNPCNIKIQNLQLGSDKTVLQYAALCLAVGTNFDDEDKNKTIGELFEKLNQCNDYINKITKTGATMKSFYSAAIADWRFIEYDHNVLTGYYAALFQNKSGECVMAFRGTNDIPDFINDALLGTGHACPQMTAALKFYDKKKEEYTITRLTGHSLGGGLANYISDLRGIRVVFRCL